MPETPKPLRSQPARDRILEAAREIFATKGYERATVRAIAAAAAINPSMVIRYYGSKEALFASVATLDFKVTPLMALPRSQFGEALVQHVLDRWDDPKDGAALEAMMRVSTSNEAARERIVAQFTGQLSGLFAAIGPAAAVAAPFIATEILGLTMGRYVWRIPAIARLSKAVIVKRVGKTVQCYLDDLTV
jgi:AcrR family transcriptional regulator